MCFGLTTKAIDNSRPRGRLRYRQTTVIYSKRTVILLACPGVHYFCLFAVGLISKLFELASEQVSIKHMWSVWRSDVLC